MRLPTRPSTRSPLQQQPKTGKSFRSQGAGQVRPRTTPAKRELEAETRLSMVTKIMEWRAITALLMVVSWRPFARYQIPLDLVVCAGAVMGVLALISSNTEC